MSGVDPWSDEVTKLTRSLWMAESQPKADKAGGLPTGTELLLSVAPTALSLIAPQRKRT
jgi:hypothetical protein